MFKIVGICSVLLAGAFANYPNYQDNVVDLTGWTLEPRIPIDISSQPEPYPYRAPKVVKPIIYGLPPPPPPAIVIPKPAKPVTEIIAVNKVGLISSILSNAYCAVRSLFTFVFTNVPALALGVLGAIGVCKFTSLCQISTIQAIVQAKDEILTNKLDFLKNAVEKYSVL